MISGSTLVRHTHVPFAGLTVGRHPFPQGPYPHLGDAPVDHTLEITKLQLSAADRAQAVDYLIGKQQSDRQAEIQKMALDASQKAFEQAQVGQMAIIEAGQVSQAQLSRNLKTTAIVGLALLAGLKIIGLFKAPKEAA